MQTASLQGLRVFCAVAKSNSFKTAAEESFLSPSAISHRIKTLEESLGESLFERKARSINLTIFGSKLLVRIAPLIEQIDKEMSELLQVENSSNIRITLPPFFSTELFLPKLNTFTDSNEGVVITLDTQDGHPEKHSHESDLSILLCDKKPNDVNAMELFPLVLVPACAPSLQIQEEDLVLENLANMKLLIHSPRRNAWAQWFKQKGKGNLMPRNVMVLDSMFAVVRAAEQGLGLALVPEILIDNWVDKGTLVKFTNNKLITFDSYYVVTHSEALEKPHVVKLRNWIVDMFQ